MKGMVLMEKSLNQSTDTNLEPKKLHNDCGYSKGWKCFSEE